MSAGSPHQTDSLHDSHSIEVLTNRALEAARAGDWDRVDACYSARGISLATSVVDRAVVEHLLAVDEEVRAAVLVAQAGISGLLADAAQARRHLRRLRESISHLDSENGTIHCEA